MLRRLASALVGTRKFHSQHIIIGNYIVEKIKCLRISDDIPSCCCLYSLYKIVKTYFQQSLARLPYCFFYKLSFLAISRPLNRPSDFTKLTFYLPWQRCYRQFRYNKTREVSEINYRYMYI